MISIAKTSILNSNKKRGHRKSDRKVHFDTSKNEVRFYTVGEALRSCRSRRRMRKSRKMGQKHKPRLSRRDWSVRGDCKNRDKDRDISRKSFVGVLSSTLCQAEEGNGD